VILYLKRFFRALGIDYAIAYSMGARIIQATGGVVTVFFIARYLTKQEQGFYFTFGSILAIQLFFELGLNSIITQYVAHEAAHLTWTKEGKALMGEGPYLSRLSSLLHFCVKWFGILSVCLFVVLLIAGSIFFNKYGNKMANIYWFLPWVILSCSTAITLLLNPLLAVLEGLGKVKKVAALRLLQQTVNLIVLYAALASGGKLYSGGLAALLALTVIIIRLFCSEDKDLLMYLWRNLGDARVNYKREILPYQWKLALSWVSGYFIFQFFTPVLFAVEGAVIAGKMGLTLAALNGILAVALSFNNTKVPVYSGLIAKRQYMELDKLFFSTLYKSTAICIVGVAAFSLFIYMIDKVKITFLDNRFLPLTLIILLGITTVANQVISGLATYLRCHKEEPMLVQSVVIGTLTCLSTLWLGNLYGVNGIVGGYCFLTVICSLIWTILLFRIKRLEWHKI